MLGDALGARGDDVRSPELVQQIGAHDADQLRGAAERQDDRRQRQMLEQVEHLAPAPAGELVFRGEQPTDIGAEEPERQVHDDQRQQEVRHRETDEADQGEDIVADRVLAHRRVDADRQRQAPDQEQGGERDQHGEPQPVADHLADRPVPFHRHAEVAGDHAHDPLGVLDVERLAEAVELAQRHRLGLRDRRAAGRQLGDVGGDEVAGRQLDDRERQHRDHPDGQGREQQPSNGEREHGGTTPRKGG